LHFCPEPSCANKPPFARRSSLKRHRKAVHKVGVLSDCNKWYLCTSASCRLEPHLWARLDMFKRHCRRKHSGHSVDDLVARFNRVSQVQSLLLT
jgi:hypothetical protein